MQGRSPPGVCMATRDSRGSVTWETEDTENLLVGWKSALHSCWILKKLQESCSLGELGGISWLEWAEAGKWDILHGIVKNALEATSECHL